MNLLALLLLMGFVTVVALPSILWLYALADVVRNRFRQFSIKIIWALILCTFPPLGTLLYFLVGREQRVTRYPVGKLVLIGIFVIPALMILWYVLFSLGHISFMPDPPKEIQI